MLGGVGSKELEHYKTQKLLKKIYEVAIGIEHFFQYFSQCFVSNTYAEDKSVFPCLPPENELNRF